MKINNEKYKNDLAQQNANYKASLDKKQKDYDDAVITLQNDHQIIEESLKGQIGSLEAQIVEMVNEKNNILGEHQDEIQKFNKNIQILKGNNEELQVKLTSLQFEKHKLEKDTQEFKLKYDKRETEHESHIL